MNSTFSDNDIPVLLSVSKKEGLLKTLCNTITVTDEYEIKHYIKTFINIQHVMGGECSD